MKSYASNGRSGPTISVNTDCCDTSCPFHSDLISMKGALCTADFSKSFVF